MPTESSEIRLILLIDLDADPITGSLETADGRLHGFSGWIGLTATLSAIRYAKVGVAHRCEGRTHRAT